MAFRDSIQRTWRENILFSALVELTYQCNLDCFFCYNDLGLQGKRLTTEQYLRFFEDLRALGTMNLILTGGEPLAHPDFFLLGRKARELDFVVRVKSNGHALRERLARRLKEEVDPFVVEVSLHGACAATHDRQTRLPGSFVRLMANLEQMLRLGLRVKLNSTLTAWNEHEIEAMFGIADELGLPLQIDPEVTPRDDGDISPTAISPSRQGALRLFQIQAERSAAAQNVAHKLLTDRDESAANRVQQPEKHCGAGSSGIALDPYGNVYPCVQWRRSIGNLHTQPIGTIWTGSDEVNEVRRLSTEAKKMVDSYGRDGATMAFCPGSANDHSGNPLHIYPAAQLRMELRKQAQEAKSMFVTTSKET